ncbi:MAG: AtzE family amidohydrolase, partial [Alphaproteobacteria bacterium]
MTQWTHEPAHEIAKAVRNGVVTARQLTEQHLSLIAARNDGLRAFTDITANRALEKADAIDAAHAQGLKLPP